MIDVLSESLDKGIMNKLVAKGRLSSWDHTRQLPEVDDEFIETATDDTVDCIIGNMFASVYPQFANKVCNMLASIVADLEARGEYEKAQIYKVTLSQKQILSLLLSYMTKEVENGAE